MHYMSSVDEERGSFSHGVLRCTGTQECIIESDSVTIGKVTGSNDGAKTSMQGYHSWCAQMRGKGYKWAGYR